MSGAWTSRFARARRPTTRRARCSPHSTSRSGSEDLTVLKRGYLGDLNGEEEFDRKEQPAAPDGQEIFRPSHPAQGDRERQDQADRGTFRGLAEACGDAAQLVAHPHPQPLRDEWPAARLLPQAQAQPYRAPGARLQGHDPRSSEVKLVGASSDGIE